RACLQCRRPLLVFWFKEPGPKRRLSLRSARLSSSRCLPPGLLSHSTGLEQKSAGLLQIALPFRIAGISFGQAFCNGARLAIGIERIMGPTLLKQIEPDE